MICKNYKSVGAEIWMKITFVASIRGKQQHIAAYKRIVSTLHQLSSSVFSDHVMGTQQQQLDKMSDPQDQKFHLTIFKKINSSDIVVSEASHESMSVGYLLAYAVEQGKPVVVFYSKKKDEPNLFPTLVRSEKVIVVQYSSEQELPELVRNYVEYAVSKADTRFNFFISPSITSYLDWISKNKNIPRSVYLRGLIEKDMKEDKAYNA